MGRARAGDRGFERCARAAVWCELRRKCWSSWYHPAVPSVSKVVVLFVTVHVVVVATALVVGLAPLVFVAGFVFVLLLSCEEALAVAV